MAKKNIFLIVGGITTVYILTVCLFYYIKFDGELSSDQSDWGTFGDYIGGLLNPLIALLNVMAFIYLTIVIEEQSSKKGQREKLERQLTKAIDELVEIQFRMLDYSPQKNDLLEALQIRKSIILWGDKNAVFLTKVGIRSTRIIRLMKIINSESWESVLDKKMTIMNIRSELTKVRRIIQEYILG